MRKSFATLEFIVLTIIYLSSGNVVSRVKVVAGVLQSTEKHDNPISAFDDTTLAEPDWGADIVATFYKVLNDKKDPSLEIDSKLFDSPALWRSVFVERKILKPGESLMAWCRDHKELFVPKHMSSLADIQISSTFSFSRNVESRKGRPRSGQGWVLVIYVKDKCFHTTIL